MRFAVDIDGTIAGRNVPVVLKTCNERCNFLIPEDELRILSYRAFLQRPEIAAYRLHVGDEKARRVIGWVDFDPEVLKAALPLSGAVAGVTRLHQFGPVTYYTARFTADDEKRNSLMEEATKSWLLAHGFPSAASVVFCRNVADKLFKLAELVTSCSYPVTLIDDQYVRLLEVVARLETRQHETFEDGQCQMLIDALRRSFHLVAFRATSQPQDCYGIPIIPCPSWQQINDMVYALGLE